MTSRRKQYLMGMRWGLPVVFGFIPVGIAYAIMARQAGFTIAETVGMSALIFAGASQIMAVGMYAQGAAVVAMILTTLILNLRHLIMSTCVFNRIRSAGLPAKLLAAFGVTDESFAIFTTAEEEQCSIYSLLGLITVTYSSWLAGSAMGAVASDLLPELITASFGIALYALFLALLMPGLRGNVRLGLLIVLTAVCNTVLSRFLEPSWALIASTLLCAAIGIPFVELEGDAHE